MDGKRKKAKPMKPWKGWAIRGPAGFAPFYGVFRTKRALLFGRGDLFAPDLRVVRVEVREVTDGR